MKSKMYVSRKVFLLIVFFSIGLCAQPTKVRVACIGNSITYGGLGENSYPEQLGKKLGTQFDVRNYGVSARTLLKKGDYPYWNESAFTEALNFDPHIVIIKLGTNDSKPQNWIYKDQFFSDYMDLVAAFRKFNRRPQIYVCFPVPVYQTNWGINDSTVRKIIPIIDSVRKAAHTFLIDFYSAMKDKGALFPDGVHPNATGYEIMAQVVYDTIMHGQSGVIRYFYSTQESLNKNETAKLYWNTSENSQVWLNGNPVNAIDSLVIIPTQTTTYTLKTKGIVTDSISRTVQYSPPGKIKKFGVDIPFFEKDKKDTVALHWTTGAGSVVKLNNVSVAENGNQFVTSALGTTFTLVAHGDVIDSQTITIPLLSSENYNRAYHRPVSATTTEWGYVPQAINDGDTNTTWRSGNSASQTITMDFGKTITVNKVVLTWGKVYGTRYYLILATDSGSANIIYNVDESDGGVDEITGLTGSGVNLRLLCLKNSIAGLPIELKEFEVYGTQGVTRIDNKNINNAPRRFLLEQNFPNPFNPVTIISYQIPLRSMVSLKVFDTLGREVAVLVQKEQNAGLHSVLFEGKNLSSGMYVYKLQAGTFVETKKMLLLK